MLKRLDLALKEKDHIYGTVRSLEPSPYITSLVSFVRSLARVSTLQDQPLQLMSP